MEAVLEGNCARAYPNLQNITMSKHILIIVLYTSNPFASVWWVFFPSLENLTVSPACGAVEGRCSPLGRAALGAW